MKNNFHSEFWGTSWSWPCDHLSLHWLHCHYCWGERLLPDILSNSLDPNRLLSGVPSPNFQWSFNGSTSLPSGVTAMPTVMSSSNSTNETYTSTLQFFPSSQSHTGMYTCRLGAGRLVNSTMVTVDGMIRIRIAACTKFSINGRYIIIISVVIYITLYDNIFQ